MLLNAGVWPVALPEIMRWAAVHVIAIAYVECMTMPEITNVANMELHKRKFCHNVAADQLVKCKCVSKNAVAYTDCMTMPEITIDQCSKYGSAQQKILSECRGWPVGQICASKTAVVYIDCMTIDQCSKYGAAQKEILP